MQDSALTSEIPRCPRGCGPLDGRCVGEGGFQHCRACRGVWFHGNNLENLIQRVRGRTGDRALPAPRPGRRGRPTSPGPVRCLCAAGTIMVEEERHGVTVDICACGAVWLDGGELEELIRRRLDAGAEPGERRQEGSWLDGDLWPLDIVLEVIAGILDW